MVYAPSWHSIQVNRPHLIRTLWGVRAIAGKFLSLKDIIMTSYLKVFTYSSTWSRAQSSVPDATWVSVAVRWRSFCSVPILHIVVPRCPTTITSWGINMSHYSCRGWGLGPMFRTRIVSSIWRCMKRNHRLVGLVELPEHPPNRQSMAMDIRRNATQ